MPSVSQIAENIVRREGGYVNDPNDPGGATNHGVTLATLKRLGLDVNSDGVITNLDVRALSEAQAVMIFTRHYFEAPGLGKLPVSVQASVFDMYVNAGSNAVTILQKLLNNMGMEVGVDGLIGPETVRAAARANRLAPNYLKDAYGIERRNYYYHLGDIRKSLRKFARRKDGGKGGWIVRAENFIARRFWLTDAQHRERTRSWV
ncbi:MAG: peptidoglycan-binding protein [Alphaproteobacteria bacterium]|nr:peptidoglycan-binding protein [Alphaproteobacteria bacterium]